MTKTKKSARLKPPADYLVGSGLIFAGVSGWCGMARLLGLMPWNRNPV